MRATRLGLAALAVGLTACAASEETGSETATSKLAAETGADAITRSATRSAYFGDVHVHTANSFDAYTFGVRRTPEDAYRFAMGEAIPHDAGYEIQLEGPPLDFLAVTDHGEYLGIVPRLADPSHPLSQTETAKAAFGDDRAAAVQTFQSIGASFVLGQPIEEIRDQAVMDSVWAETVAAAERFNRPGEFTTFAGYEFTAMRMVDPALRAAANLHRNVIFADEAPERIYSTLDSNNPEDLWDWMNTQREAGFDVLAIPHNSNASNGWMFALETYQGEPLTAAYALNRLANEPLVEVTQIKGTSETRPEFSPNDEWAGFEQYEYMVGSAAKSTFHQGDFVRPTLGRGLALEESMGANPFKFGLIGSSDTHIAAATLREDKHWGKFPTDGASPRQRSSVPPEGYTDWDNVPPATVRRVLTGSQYSASGLVGVWAEANTRDDIFAAMRRRETFATTGPRMKIRLFAGDYDEALLDAPDLLERAYADGVAMGGDLVRGDADAAPALIAWAIQDPISAPLERLQVIKVWAEGGEAREAVFDVACSGGETPDPVSHRCPENGASVDTSTCETTPGSGTGELKTVWHDPSWAPGQKVAYYARVLENPTCRWSTWDAVRAGTPPNPELPVTLQERAWSSPIWLD